MTSPYLIVLDAADRHRLTRWVWAGSTPQKLVLRALIVLL
ncbi:IS630 family transposase, partial [Mycobacterium helveticum]